MKVLQSVMFSIWIAIGVGGCMSVAKAPNVDLQRSLYPAPGTMGSEEIPQAFRRQIDLSPPLSGGIVWLADEDPGISADSRTNVPDGP